MSNNEALTVTDHWEWLVQTREHVSVALSRGAPGVVLSCSVWRERYRDVIRILALEIACFIQFIYLKPDSGESLGHVDSRPDRAIENSAMSSRVNILEEPRRCEIDVVVVAVHPEESGVLEKIISQISVEA